MYLSRKQLFSGSSFAHSLGGFAFPQFPIFNFPSPFGPSQNIEIEKNQGDIQVEAAPVPPNFNFGDLFGDATAEANDETAHPATQDLDLDGVVDVFENVDVYSPVFCPIGMVAVNGMLTFSI